MTDVTYVPSRPRVTYGCYLARSLLVYGPYQLPVTWYLLVEMYFGPIAELPLSVSLL